MRVQIKGTLDLPHLTWYDVPSKPILEDWERVILDEHNAWRTYLVIEEMVDHVNSILEVPFSVIDEGKYNYRLLEHLHSELEKMVLPNCDGVVSTIGPLVDIEEGTYNHQCCYLPIVRLLKTTVSFLSIADRLILTPVFEANKILWFMEVKPCQPQFA